MPNGYMCKICWDHEVGQDAHGPYEVYPSVEAYQRGHGDMTGHCGLVEIEMRLVRVVTETRHG